MGNSIRSRLLGSPSSSTVCDIDAGSGINLTSEAHDDNWIADDEDFYSDAESPLEKVRSILKATQGNVSQCEEVINAITSFDEDLSSKCETIAVTNLLPQNSTLADAGNFSVISMGVDVLIEYGINLLKPKKNPNWRSIKLSNGVFKSKVQPLKGYEDVLRELGYTERNTNGFDFPPSTQPDVDKVAEVTTDLLILQRELNQFISQTHVNSERFLKSFLYQLNEEPVILSAKARYEITQGLERTSQQNYQENEASAETQATKMGFQTDIYGRIKVSPSEEVHQDALLPILETSSVHDSVEGYVRPSETVKQHIGMFKGIQGDHNSCYMDVTLYSMFAFSDVFDAILHCEDTAKTETKNVKDALRTTIVNPLRTFGFVRADPVLHFRDLLSLLNSTEGFRTEEKDPREFIHALLQDLGANPFLKISQDNNATMESFVYQIFTDKKKYLDIPTVKDLLHVSFLESNLKLSEVPECFIIQLPRYDKKCKLYDWIIPSLKMDIRLLIRDSPRYCCVCGKLAFMECQNCTPEYKSDDIIQSYCGKCFSEAHKSEKHHQCSPLAISKSFYEKYQQIAEGLKDYQIASATEHLYEERLMELFSVVCIETSHYVAFVKTGRGEHAHWVIFDSKADRRGDQQGFCVPEVLHLKDIEKQIRREDLKDALKRNEELPEYLKRLLSDAYICFYHPLKFGGGISPWERTIRTIQNVPSSQREAFRTETKFSQQNYETLSKSSQESHVVDYHSKCGNNDSSHKKRETFTMDQSFPKTGGERYNYESTQNSYSQPFASLHSIFAFTPLRSGLTARQQEIKKQGHHHFHYKSNSDEIPVDTGDIPCGVSEFADDQVASRYDTSSNTQVRATNEGYTRNVAEGGRQRRLEHQQPLVRCISRYRYFDPLETEDVPKPLKDPLQTSTKPKISSPVQVKPKANNKPRQEKKVRKRKKLQSQFEKVVLEDVHSLEQNEIRWKGISDQDLDQQKTRNFLREEHGLTWSEIDTVLALTKKYELCECLEAVKAVGNNLQRALDYFQECATCFTHFGMHKLVAIPTCKCLLCRECFAQNFSVLVKTTTCMYKFSCPVCNNPKLEDSDQKSYQDYFSLLGPLLKTYLEKKDYELYETKLATWELTKDPNFRWCAHGCSAGFINERPWKKIQCPECKKYQCSDCKKPWMDQHENISCEKFDAWKKANDPEFQQQGLAAHLKENGIDCPKCKMHYELAKGGCMHFKCPQCHHQFCCGCNLPFRTNPACNLLPSCEGKGLHAHHPRDCLYYLRDENCHDLQRLLQKHRVHYNPSSNAAGYNGERPQVCPVKEQQETPDGLVDAICGEPLRGQCGLCENHYKEYLVGLINQHNIDPVEVFGVKSLEATLRRNDRKIPLRAGNETNADYCARLRQEVQQLLPLRPRNAQSISGAMYQL